MVAAMITTCYRGRQIIVSEGGTNGNHHAVRNMKIKTCFSSVPKSQYGLNFHYFIFTIILVTLVKYLKDLFIKLQIV